MSEKFTPESFETYQKNARVFDLSRELYEGGKAEISKLGDYVKTAQEKGVFQEKRLDLTGGTMMVIYAAISAEAGRPTSNVKEFAFNNPAREGRVVLWNSRIALEAPEKPTKSLMVEAPTSKVDPRAPTEVLDLRLTYADNPEAIQEMANPQKAENYMKEIIAQVRELKSKGVDTLRITGIPTWLAQGAFFAAAREGINRLISYTPTSEIIVYDAENPEMVGKGEMVVPKEVVVDLSDKEIKDLELVKSGIELEKTLGIDLAGNKIELKGVDLGKIPPEVALRAFDSFHSFASSLKVAGIEVFQHLDPRSHDLVPKTKERNPELLEKEKRGKIVLDIHKALMENENDPEKTALILAKEAVNKANTLVFTGITNEIELAIAGKVAHAAHGLIEELRYQQNEGKEIIVKSWRVNKN